MSAQKKPDTTFYASSTSETTELAWKLKRLTETHEMRQRSLIEEYTKKSEALTTEMQERQSAVFEELRAAMNVPNADWGDGKAWALNIKDLSDGTVALVHDQDQTRVDDCQCPICQLHRAVSDLSGDDSDKGDEALTFH